MVHKKKGSCVIQEGKARQGGGRKKDEDRVWDSDLVEDEIGSWLGRYLSQSRVSIRAFPHAIGFT